jgi:hypothetical protein
MAVCIEPEATAEARLPRDLLLGRTLDVVDEPAVGFILLSQYVGEREVAFLFRHSGIEGIDAAVRYGVPRWPVPVDDERQMFQRLLLPPRHVRDNVLYRPIARDATFRQLRVRQTRVRRFECRPRLVELFQKLLPIHGSGLANLHYRPGAPRAGVRGSAEDHVLRRPGRLQGRVSRARAEIRLPCETSD